MGKKVFVTVGTTKFDKLIQTIVDDDILKLLNKKGYNEMILQIGKSSIQPNCKPRFGFEIIDSFNLKPSIQEHMVSADLIISHAGAGSCLEALEAGKPLVVVTNDLLMDNHQLELANQLHKDNHLYHCSCDELLKTLETMDLNKLVPLASDKSQQIARTIDSIMGLN